MAMPAVPYSLEFGMKESIRGGGPACQCSKYGKPIRGQISSVRICRILS
jgi:hypothetical protein